MEIVILIASGINAIAVVVLVIVTYKYAKHAKQMVDKADEQRKVMIDQLEEMRNQRIEGNKPIVVIRYIQLIRPSCEIDMKDVENIGKGPALNVEIRANFPGIEHRVKSIQALGAGMKEERIVLQCLKREMGVDPYATQPLFKGILTLDYYDIHGYKHRSTEEYVLQPKGKEVLEKRRVVRIERLGRQSQ